MQFKLGSMLLVALIALVAFIGCDIGRDMMMEHDAIHGYRDD